MRVAILVLGLCACDVSLSDMDNVYSRGADREVLCSINVDNKNTVSNDSIAAGLDRAQVDRVVLHLYTHRPAGTVDESTIEHILASAADRSLPFVTYRDLVDGTASEGLAFSFDDRDITGWFGLRDLFARYDARVTFFISQYHALTPEERDRLRVLAAEGHSIDYHSTEHEDAEDYSATHGVDAYIANDIVPNLVLMRAEGFSPMTFAYPYGSRTTATDAAILEHVPLIRTSRHTCPH